MQFDPKFSFWLGVIVTALIGIAGGTVHLTNAIPADWIPAVTAWASLLSFIGSGLLTAMHGYSSAQNGPLVSQPPPSVPKVLLPILLAAGLAMAWAGPAGAQAPRLTGNPVKDFAPKPAAPSSGAIASPVYDSIGGELQKVIKDVIDKAITDLTAASTDAKGTSDLISQPCWDAQVTFLKLLPAEWPTPPTDVGPALAIQIGRDLRRALTSDQPGSLKVACAALFGDELQQAGKLFSILGLRAAGLAIGLPIP